MSKNGRNGRNGRNGAPKQENAKTVVEQQPDSPKTDR